MDEPRLVIGWSMIAVSLLTAGGIAASRVFPDALGTHAAAPRPVAAASASPADASRAAVDETTRAAVTAGVLLSAAAERDAKGQQVLVGQALAATEQALAALSRTGDALPPEHRQSAQDALSALKGQLSVVADCEQGASNASCLSSGAVAVGDLAASAGTSVAVLRPFGSLSVEAVREFAAAEQSRVATSAQKS